jgi:uncharacterized membrane protein
MLKSTKKIFVAYCYEIFTKKIKLFYFCLILNKNIRKYGDLTAIS